MHPPSSAIDQPIVIVLAAGTGSRFRASGGQTHKLAATLQSRSVLEHVLEAVRQSGLRSHLVTPDTGGAGMGDSIAAGVRATRGATGWLVLPGDLALVQPASIHAVANALQAAGPRIVLPRFHGMQGHPVGFPRACMDALSHLTGDRGASSIVRTARSREDQGVIDLPLEDEGIVTDIDTVQDLERARALFSARSTR